eukprot:2706476-Prorocentrum_lima.AAC.1
MVAGCSCATGVARVLLTGVLDRAHALGANLLITNVVDDISMRKRGAERAVLKDLVQRQFDTDLEELKLV